MLVVSERIGRSETAADQLEDAELENDVFWEGLKSREAEIAQLRAENVKVREGATLDT